MPKRAVAFNGDRPLSICSGAVDLKQIPLNWSPCWLAEFGSQLVNGQADLGGERFQRDSETPGISDGVDLVGGESRIHD